MCCTRFKHRGICVQRRVRNNINITIGLTYQLNILDKTVELFQQMLSTFSASNCNFKILSNFRNKKLSATTNDFFCKLQSLTTTTKSNGSLISVSYLFYTYHYVKDYEIPAKKEKKMVFLMVSAKMETYCNWCMLFSSAKPHWTPFFSNCNFSIYLLHLLLLWLWFWCRKRNIIKNFKKIESNLKMEFVCVYIYSYEEPWEWQLINSAIKPYNYGTEKHGFLHFTFIWKAHTFHPQKS